ncbi:DNA-directed RNA polymerase subunit beta', partial [Acidobacteria bacterium ACD]|nr:DNA-directed RNA polymerase subunit beta' [Acidobacteria bacterium ACD]
MDFYAPTAASSAFSPFRSPGPRDFNAIKIALASPEKIRSWSFGEVTKPETINYRTFKPERDGLFCAKIFGPITDWECLCGKYKRMKHRGVVCDKCGVEVTKTKVRRERMGHIELAAPVSHVWFFKGLPSRIGHLLDLTLRDLEQILYFERYVIVDPGPLVEEENLKEKDLVSEERFRELKAKHGVDTFVAKMGAEAIQELLQRVNIDDLADELRLIMKAETSALKRLKAAKRLKIVDAFRRSGHRPEWMILNVIPVIPPELRPLVPLDGGRFATSDLNDLYRRVINRNNRLKKLLELRAPEVIVRNEKRMLQEAVDALFDNGRRGRVLKGSNNRPLKSLSDTLKGKTGRFRQNLLGKRVDYSGRSVIVVGPELKLNQCGLPKKMALELFKPFIYHRLEQKSLTSTIKASKELVEQAGTEVWDALEEVIKEHPVLLNRAPTLHRLGIQAFEPVLIEGKAIKIHPLVCAAFNADFDGDQMAVHVPLSPKAQVEAQVLMLSAHNILSPAHGKPLAVPSQDLVLGLYYLTRRKEGCKGEGRVFAGFDEVALAHAAGEVATHAGISVRFTGRLVDLESQVLNDQDIVHAEPIDCVNTRIETTVGRVLLSLNLPSDLPFLNGTLRKKGLQDFVNYCFVHLGLERAVQILDLIKDLGFSVATRAGISIGMEDMRIPKKKVDIVGKARKEALEVDHQRQQGAITDGERHNKIIDIWHRATEQVSDEMFKEMKATDGVAGHDFNPIYMMADSGARGSKEQVRQLAGMRGPMSKPSGEVMEQPIISNFREGLSVLEYFISTHGARKGLADTALKTADSGYLTRRLVDVAQDVIITREDCGTIDGIVVTDIKEGGEILEPLRDRVVGRISQEDVFDPVTNEQVVAVGEPVTEEIAQKIQEAGIERVTIRSVLTCETERGVCQLCYGRNLATGRLVDIGEAVGVIAAQSIGEPGTQLTMRTFHYGGTARVSEAARHVAKNPGTVRLVNATTVRKKRPDGKEVEVVVNRNSKLVLIDARGREKERYSLAYGSELNVAEGDEVKPGQVLVIWDPFASPILSETAGKASYRDIYEGENLREETDKVTGLTQKIVVETTGTTEKRSPMIVVTAADGTERRYPLPIPSHLMVGTGDVVSAGDVLAKKPVEKKRTRDIVGGLPRVVELFEARRPKEPAVITEVSGLVRHAGTFKGQQKLVVESEDGQRPESLIPRGAHVVVQEGERVEAGDPLTEGDPSPHDILRVRGVKELQRYMTDKIQEVYRSQGVAINDKHIEVIVRQMMRSVKIEEVGDTEFLIDEQVDKFRFREENDRVIAAGGRPARGEPLLLGITKASLSTDSFISAASF